MAEKTARRPLVALHINSEANKIAMVFRIARRCSRFSHVRALEIAQTDMEITRLMLFQA